MHCKQTMCRVHVILQSITTRRHLVCSTTLFTLPHVVAAVEALGCDGAGRHDGRGGGLISMSDGDDDDEGGDMKL